ncbi:hypothetical protein J3998_08915 [Thiomicrorhabdus sp. 6S2-11]|jgi:hypothetical protein|uniref:Uncharacterized protein n=1 Tax=Thiomicrorhabdus marina TaxID=2818442 RepID=A0ABS3Q5S3_9GAMM|nr:hypothetical protein [Thiomicrorhabdus marina]MBO1927695.1 hypothetical protein [Thiomicrorhabdus marina]
MDAQSVSQITEMMYALRNPAGLPTYPIIFVGLSVLTFAMHILFVQLLLGTSLVALYGAYTNNPLWRRLGMAMIDVAKVSVSVAIVIGVAPLLFVQVVYDPHWYTSNVLSADWVIAFIIILILAYWAMYLYYFQNYKREDKTAQPKSRWSLIVSLALMLLVGFIMHSLTSQILHPELWKEWYMQNGKLDYSGDTLHAYNFWRYAFFISMSIPVAGAMMVTYRRFKMVREDADMQYLNFAAEVGKKWILVGSVIATILYVAWMLTIQETAGAFATSFWGIIGGVAVLGYALWAKIRLNGKSEDMCSYMALPMALVIGLVVATSREILRYDILNGFFGYDFFDYKIVMDWYSTGLFFLTFAIVGGVVLSYFLTIAWKAGQTVGVYTPGPGVQKLGTAAIWIVALWLVQFFVVGFYVWAQ